MSYVGALGAATITDPRAAFQVKFADLLGRINGAIMWAASKGASGPALQTMSNNVAALSRIKDQVMAGDTAKMLEVARVGNAIIDEARQYGPPDINVMELLAREIADIPAKFNRAVQKAAAATGKAVATVAAEAGVDPKLLVSEVSGVAKWGAVAAVALAALYLTRR